MHAVLSMQTGGERNSVESKQFTLGLLFLAYLFKSHKSSTPCRCPSPTNGISLDGGVVLNVFQSTRTVRGGADSPALTDFLIWRGGGSCSPNTLCSKCVQPEILDKQIRLTDLYFSCFY